MITFALLLLLASYVDKAQSVTFDVRKYGATPNADITKALAIAWTHACASRTPSKVVVPKGTYMLRQIYLRGPCKAPIEVQVHGTILAPENPDQFDGNAQWVRFEYVNFFTLSGGGTFDGQGEMAWKLNDCAKNLYCKTLPMNLGFGFVNNLIIRDITSKDSKHFHVNVLQCKNVTFTNFNVKAPATSPNTNGIHIVKSSRVNIISSIIGTGDDCISLGDGSKRITIQNVTCGPGHGISVGSLGRHANEESIKGILVRNCTLNNTENGVRIKTLPNTPVASVVSGLHIEDIIMVNVSNPMIIDQEYCPWNQFNEKTPSKVKIRNAASRNITRTFAAQEEISLIYSSSGVPYEILELEDTYQTFKGYHHINKLVESSFPLLNKLVKSSFPLLNLSQLHFVPHYSYFSAHCVLVLLFFLPFYFFFLLR